jgi:hypothetical protein
MADDNIPEFQAEIDFKSPVWNRDALARIASDLNPSKQALGRYRALVAVPAASVSMTLSPAANASATDCPQAKVCSCQAFADALLWRITRSPQRKL